MQIEQMQYLAEVAKTKSISTASDNLYVSQPAISKSLKNLEKMLGTKLFYSNRYGVELTAEGREIAKRATEALQYLNSFEKGIALYLKTINTSLTGSLKIYATQNIAISILPDIINYFIKIYPNISPYIVIESYYQIVDALIHNQCDVALLMDDGSMLPQASDYHIQFITTSQLYIAMDSKHPLHHKLFLTIDDLKPYKWISFSNRVVSAEYGINELHEFEQSNTYIHSTDFSVILQLLVNSTSLTITCDLLQQHPLILANKLTLIPFRMNSNSTSRIAAVSLISNTDDPVLNAFLQTLPHY